MKVILCKSNIYVLSAQTLTLPDPDHRNAHIAWGDLFAQPVANADVVMIFGVTPLMKGT